MNPSDQAVKPNWLFTDLDGTLIPLDGDRQNVLDLLELTHVLDEQNIGLVFNTGRHFDSASQAIAEFSLPEPSWIICDVGTTIVETSEENRSLADDYTRELSHHNKRLGFSEIATGSETSIRSAIAGA